MKQIILLVTLTMWLTGHSQNILKISQGTSLRIDEPIFIVAENTSLINNGYLEQLSRKGAFKFTGEVDATISGINPTTFSRMIIAKTGKSKLFLQQHVSVIGELNFSAGLLDLNSFNIDLGNTGLLSGENETSRVIGDKGGYIQSITDLHAPSSVNPGNLGAIFTSSQHLGTAMIRRSHQLQQNETGTGARILRSYDIRSAATIDLTTRLRFTYLDAELNKADEDELVIWRSGGDRNWTNLGFKARSKTTNYIESSISSSDAKKDASHFIYHIAANDKSVVSTGRSNNNPNYVKESWKVWPNPVIGNLSININTSVESKAIIKIVDDKGALISWQQDDLHPGNNILKVDMKKLTPGTYLVVSNWLNGQMQKTMTIVKM